MAAAQRPSPILLLSDVVDTRKFTDDPVPDHGWKKIECASKRAYGCGQHANGAVQGLTLYACPGADDGSPLASSLAIRMTDEAFQSFDSEIQLTYPLELKEMLVDDDNRMIAAGIVQMADEQGLTVILLSFGRQFCQDLAYYLVYDQTNTSLSMIPYVPDLFEAICTPKPVAKRDTNNDFELFIVGRDLSPTPRRILCACTPETRASTASSDGAGPWLINKPFEHEEFKEPFMADADVAFTFQGKGIWGNLLRGFMYCDLEDMTSNDFGFIGLPCECLPGDDSEEDFDFDDNIKASRTMSCVGDSIWFVCIDEHPTEPKDDLVKMWSLKGSFQNNPRWEKMVEVRVSEMWGFDGFEEARLPRITLEYPALTADGALCAVLPDQNKIQRNRYRGPVETDICIFDMSLKRLQWHGVVHRHMIWSSFLISPEASIIM